MAKISAAETESILRRGGLTAMVDNVASLNGSAIKKYDEKGRLTDVSSGTTSVAIDEMARLLPETIGLPSDQLANKMIHSSWWGEPMETFAALEYFGKVDAHKALELADTLKGESRDSALKGAFLSASEHQPQVALDYLAKVTDISRQNSLLNILAQKSKDPEIRKECVDILAQRGIHQ